MRVAFFSPLPPERSGIADYSYELLEELRNHLDIAAVVRDDFVTRDLVPDGVELIGISSVRAVDFDCDVYQMGNNAKFHQFLFQRALDEPGLLVLHDPSLADFHAEVCGGAESSIFREEVHYDTADIGPRDDLPLVDASPGRKDLDRLRVLMARRILESSARTLVNSSAIEHELRRRYPGIDIASIQLPSQLGEAIPLPSARGDGSISFGVFGGINYYKRIESVVAAFMEVHREFPSSRLVIAGRPDDLLLTRRLRATAMRPELGGALVLKTELTLAELELEMAGVDVAISLRWPTAGEMSATLMRTFGAGRAAIVTDVMQFRELDEAFCWRIPVEPEAEEPALLELMRRLARSPQVCVGAGAAARRFVEREATYAKVAEDYVHHIRDVGSRRSSIVRKRSAFVPIIGTNLIVSEGASRDVRIAAHRVAEVLGLAGVDVIESVLRPLARLDRTQQTISASSSHGTSSIWASTPDADDEAVELLFEDPSAIDAARAGGPYDVDICFVDAPAAEDFERFCHERIRKGRRILALVATASMPLPVPFGPLLAGADDICVPSKFGEDLVAMHSTRDVSLATFPVSGANGVGPGDHVQEPSVCRVLVLADATEGIAQSNPWAAIAAYQVAFLGDRSSSSEVVTELTVVSYGMTDHPEALGRLRAEVEDSSGRLVEDPDDGQFGALVRRCDVLLSLSRGEAFGVTIADAMACGKVVVVTGYGASLDFVTPETGITIPFMIRPADDGLYHLEPDLALADSAVVWAVPDVDAAAAALRRLARNSALRTRLGDAAERHVKTQLSQSKVGADWRALLVELRARPRVWGKHQSSPAHAQL